MVQHVIELHHPLYQWRMCWEGPHLQVLGVFSSLLTSPGRRKRQRLLGWCSRDCTSGWFFQEVKICTLIRCWPFTDHPLRDWCRIASQCGYGNCTEADRRRFPCSGRHYGCVSQKKEEQLLALVAPPLSLYIKYYSILCYHHFENSELIHIHHYKRTCSSTQLCNFATASLTGTAIFF